MGGDGAAAEATQQRWQLLDRFSLTHLRRAAVIAVLVVTAAFGGLNQADIGTHISFGAPYENGPLVITPRSLRAVCDPSQVPRTAAAVVKIVKTGQVIALNASIENTSMRTVPFDVPLRKPNYRNTPDNIFELMSPPTSSNYAGVFAEQGPLTNADAISPGKSAEYTIIWTVPKSSSGNEFHIRMHNTELATTKTGAPAYLWRVAPDGGYGDLRASAEGCDKK
ncbi:hypothetical protein FZI91_05990 [Mycobacterium sp. CBMA271]|uniref:hypothetical protein n=1 Tax=unclassified Mycobacteroides TaxID=2618759 RepID=UPI0012DFD169|nr:MULTISPECIES: hypothetical protein [unclassified Mycobacteroides]MUM15354.1 hypothetical protein [Mycobacteroides sp. CBMA 326]MUM21255.1 hypothetical protein [Mycobacteroides sp. CBMA 271]